MGDTTFDIIPYPEDSADVRATGTAIKTAVTRVELIKARARAGGSRALYGNGGNAGSYNAARPLELVAGYSTQVSSAAGILSITPDAGQSWSAIIAAYLQPMSDGGGVTQSWYGVLRPDQGNTAAVRWIARSLAAGNAVLASTAVHFSYLLVVQP